MFLTLQFKVIFKYFHLGTVNTLVYCSTNYKYEKEVAMLRIRYVHKYCTNFD